MPQSKSEDWLPPGWTVKERVRDNGKKYKFYHAPSNGPTFNSRAEVSRYLINLKQTNHHKAKRRKQGTLTQSGEVLVKKGEAEGLPPGWIKEIRVRKSGDTVKRDPVLHILFFLYYFDPERKSVFRSLKAVYRYLKAKELGTLAQNSEGCSHKDSDDNCTFQLGVSKTRRRINFDRSSDMNEVVQEEQVHNSSSQPSPLLEHASELWEGDTELRNPDIQGAEDLDEKGEKAHESKKSQPGSRKSKKKIVPELPRRASKRLAGLEVDPIPELKPKTRARRVAAEESGNGVASTSICSSPRSLAQCAFRQPNQLDTDPKGSEFSHHSNRSKDFSDNLVTSEKQVGKAETIVNCDDKQRFAVVPWEGQICSYDKADMKLEAPPDLPLSEFLMDPCIAFAIKTLTGVSFDNSESSEFLPGSTSSEHSSANLAVEIFGKVDTESKINREQHQRCSVVSLEEHARYIEIDNRADEKSGYPIELPFGGEWQDPCIEFAIKTLTDAIPLDYDPNIQQNFQQQPSSSKTQGSDETSFTSVQTDFSCQQFYDVKPRFQRDLQDQHNGYGTVSLRNSDGSVLNRHGKE